MQPVTYNDAFTLELGYTEQQMLVAFSEKPSFTAVADKLQIPHKRVAERLKTLDRRWTNVHGFPLLVLPPSSKTWELTEAGKQLAEQFKGLLQATQLAIGIVVGGRQVRAVCTRSALSDCARLAEDVRHQREDITLVPASQRSAAIAADLRAGDDSFYIFPALRNLTVDSFAPGRVSRVGNTLRLDVRMESLSMLVSHKVELPQQPITLLDVLNKRPDTVVICPPGGVAWDYLTAELGPAWPRLSPNNLFNAHDLDYGLQAFATSSLRRGRPAVMIVHGWTQQTVVERHLEGYAVLHDVSTTKNNWAAVTSLIRHDDRSRHQASAHDIIWKIATKSTWTERPLLKQVAG